MIARLRFARGACLGGAWLALMLGAAGEPGSVRLTIRARAAIVGETLAVAPLSTPIAAGLYHIKRGADDPGEDVDVFTDRGRSYLVMPIDRADAGATIAVTLNPGPALKTGPSIREEGSNLRIRHLGREFTEYRGNDGPKPYYWPVLGPTGAPFTRAYPMEKVDGEDKDHPHQRSMWFTHGTLNGVDFWASDPINPPKPNHGSIKETGRTIVHNGNACGVVRTTDDWLDHDGKTVCEDERTVLFSGTANTRVIDFDITIKASAGDLTFGDTKEGMFGVRVASSMDVKAKQGGKITTSEGLTDNAAWGKPAAWVDYTGPVAGQTVGIAILNHPDSFRYPTTWHVRDYGLFAANPFGWHDFGQKTSGAHTVAAGDSIRFKYRVILHKGDTEAARVPSAFEVFARPPVVEIQAE